MWYNTIATQIQYYSMGVFLSWGTIPFFGANKTVFCIGKNASSLCFGYVPCAHTVQNLCSNNWSLRFSVR